MTAFSENVELSKADFDTGLVTFEAWLVVTTSSILIWSDGVTFIIVDGSGFRLAMVDELIFEKLPIGDCTVKLTGISV